MNKPLTTLCWIVLASGVVLLIAALLQSLGVLRTFSEPPWMLGIALTAIGALLLGTRRK